MAIGQPLRIVAKFMLPEQTKWASQTNLNSQIHQGVFEPFWTLVAVMNQLAMAAERMSEQQYASGTDQEKQDGRPGNCEHSANDCSAGHADKPDRFDRRVADLSTADAIQRRGIDTMLCKTGGQAVPWDFPMIKCQLYLLPGRAICALAACRPDKLRKDNQGGY